MLLDHEPDALFPERLIEQLRLELVLNAGDADELTVAARALVFGGFFGSKDFDGTPIQRRAAHRRLPA